MNHKQYFILVFLTGAFFLNACNLAIVTPTPLFTETPLPQPTAIDTVVPVATQRVPPTPTVTMPTPTLTLFYAPTVTSTPSWEGCPLALSIKDTRKGDLLHILRCEDNLEYDLGPFSKGVYAAGPNNNFVIYVTNDGFVYGAMLGEEYLTVIVNMAAERFFSAVNKKALPEFSITFAGEAPYYKLVLREDKYEQKRIYDLPVRFGEQ